MSTWGGIGEGLTAGMNARIALEEQRRRDAQSQANADRAFQFQREQADRSFAANRADAANAQANAERQMAMGERRLDMAQANADRDFALRGEEASVRADAAAIAADQAERELALKEQGQEWTNRMNEERVRSFKLANEKLDREERQAKMIDEAKMSSGRQQLAMALYRVTGPGGQEQTITVNENGQQVQKLVRVLPQKAREHIFGTDGYFRDVQNVVAFEDESGNTVAALVKPDGTMQMFSPEQQYDIYGAAFGRQFADEQMQGAKDRRDLGMFAEKERVKATEQERARNASDPYGKKRQIDAAIAVLKADDASDADRASALQYLGSVFGGGSGGGAGGGGTAGADGSRKSAKDIAAIKAEIERRQNVSKRIPVPTRKTETKQERTQERTQEPKQDTKQEPKRDKQDDAQKPNPRAVPIQRKRRHGSETSSGSAFEINEEAVAANARREQEEMEKRERDREAFYRRMSGASIASNRRRN